jgi:hypothetical protein
MTTREALLVNAAIGTPVTAYGFYLAWWLGLAFVLFTLILIQQSRHA